MKKGFTLIELLAVIVILAILALIVSPIISGVINDAKDAANVRSVEGIIKSAELYGVENADNGIDESNNIYSELTFSGKAPSSAEVYINNKSSVAVAVVYDNKCYTKGFNDKTVSSSINDGNCTINGTSNKCFVTNGFGTIIGYRCSDDGYIFDVDSARYIEYVKEQDNIQLQDFDSLMLASQVYSDDDLNGSETKYLIDEGILYNKQTVKKNLNPVVPSKIGNENIVAIYGMHYGLDSITISEGIKYIYPHGIPYNLKKISVPNSIEVFFTFDTSSIEVNKLKGVNYIGNSTNPYLVAVSVDDNTKETYELSNNVKILFNAFEDTHMTSVNIPEGVTHINSDAFGESIFGNLNIPNSIIAMAGDSFYYTDALNTNTKDGINYIGNSTNPYLVALSVVDDTKETYTIDSNTKILLATFKYCENLNSITIPNSVKYIDYAFFGDTSLKNLVIPEGVVTFFDSHQHPLDANLTLPSTLIFYYGYFAKGKTVVNNSKYPSIRIEE